MGIFDYIAPFRFTCPSCKKEVRATDFQTKDGDVYMKTVRYWEVNNFYGTCPNCERWLEFNKRTRREPIESSYRITVEKLP